MKQGTERGGGQKEGETKRVGRKQEKADQKNNSWDRQAGWDERNIGGAD